MSKQLLWTIATLLIALTAVLAAPPAQAHEGAHLQVRGESGTSAPVADAMARPLDAEATLPVEAASQRNADCRCCPQMGQGCCTGTLAVISEADPTLRILARAFASCRDGSIAPARAFYPLNEPPAFA